MKKLMVACVAAAIAVVTNAAQVNWNSGAVLADSGDGTGWSGTDTKIKASSADYTMSVLIYTSYTAGELSGLIGEDDATGTNGKSKIAGNTKTTPDIAGGTKYYAQAEIVNTANGSTLMSQILEFEWEGKMTNPSLDFMTAAAGEGVVSLKSMNGTFDSKTGYWAAEGWQSVPEPTSGLLLLIGVAGLALRRRRA